MLWKASTYGEELFLVLYRELGKKISVGIPDNVGFNFLVSPSRFEEFTRLSATLEIFLRCVRCAKKFHEDEPHMPARNLGRMLRIHTDIPAFLYDNQIFCEFAKQTGRIAAEEKRSDQIERNALSVEPAQCYLCGVSLTKKKNARDQCTVEHIWPLSLGGETVEENIIPACKDCNDKRSNTITWAWGPVQSTFHTRSGNANPPGQLKLSLAIARLMLAASANERRPITLKDAAKKIRPVLPDLNIEEGQTYLYFELFQQFEGSV
ncbi:HNH endonuclease [Burkholderia sp. LA-2-3-30-S1-D2]|uniref:HNH endonuclease n=1 Tax=Burkholderia sp. LA-2-3-30-S1-D2 TaxID=1637862 RepID=UPI0009EC08F5|nr:HNH endonuclease signature motif containing protein [Burkholderia sp. LA-2-3-30-S1-D2]